MLFLALIIALVLPTQVLAQTTTPPTDLFPQYQKDYQYQYGLYNQSYLEYQSKLQQNTQYGSVVTQAEKTAATKNVLIARNKMLKSYAIALRVLLDKYKNFNSTDTQKLQITLSKWENWFDEQNTIVSALNNDTDINKWAGSFFENYIQIQTDLTNALIQQEINLKTAILENIKTLAASLQSQSNIYQSNQQWFNSLTVKYDLINQNLKSAAAYGTKPQNNNRFSDFYPDAKADLSRANGYLTDLVSDMKLIISKAN